MDAIIRESCESDGAAVSDLAIAAFGESEGPVISALIEDLAADSRARPMLSLVATIDNSVVGHILFTNAVIRQSSGSVSAAQNQGIGGRLILEGIVRLKAAAVDLVFVLGYPAFYSVRIHAGRSSRVSGAVSDTERAFRRLDGSGPAFRGSRNG